MANFRNAFNSGVRVGLEAYLEENEDHFGSRVILTNEYLDCEDLANASDKAKEAHFFNEGFWLGIEFQKDAKEVFTKTFRHI